MSANAAPTVEAESGSSFNLAETSRMMSNVVLLPFCNSSCTRSEDMPIPSNAVDVAVVISRRRIFASLIASIPLSEKIPIFSVWALMAINSSADKPASLKKVEYSFTFFKNSPFTSAPLIKPSFTNSRASCEVMPNCFCNAFAPRNTSTKSLLKVSETACTSFLYAFNSFPERSVNCFVRRVASINPLL